MELNFDLLIEVKCFDDIKKFFFFEDEWLCGGFIFWWVFKGYVGKLIYVFEMGGMIGIFKSWMVINDF